MVTVVIGGGIVGCWVAYEMTKKSEEVFLLEKEKALGEHTSTRNSGVIHGGMYYPRESLKARLCIRGRHLTYAFLKQHEIPHRRCGKLIVALNAQDLDEIKRLKRLGEDNGVEDLTLVDRETVQKVEPRVWGVGGLLSPQTGLVNMASYMKTMERVLKGSGVVIVKQCQVVSISDQNTLTTNRGEIATDIVINAAGLHSDSIATMCGLEDYEIVPYKGDYYSTTEKVVRGLVYPVPGSSMSLGIHLTPTFGEEILIGPALLRVSDKEDYEIRTPRQEFEQGAQAVVPDLDLQRLYPGFSGNRSKVYYRGELQTDFIVEQQEEKRVHLLGIESPGITAAPALAEYVSGIIP
jgi:L-2-hydroxyglutarate oxidase LhgO